MTAKNYRKREIEAYSEYQKILHNVKVLDPACGSGAFLVRVFDWLLAENKRVTNILYETNDQMKLGDDENYFREILKNNIYGVDLNEESVEITKLSLWLKSAQKGKKLLTLDNNIKCGNSLIDDPTVAGDKAFNWNTEFADIMGSGGFDVIVGNPPYVRNTALQNKEKDYLSQSYFS
ncbi:MAG: DNA methyltransferase [bacterium]